MCPVSREVNERLQMLCDRLREYNILCIVEGPLDRKALHSLGITNIVMLHKHPLFEVVESIPCPCEVAILTDLDSEGKSLYGKLFKELQRRGCTIDDSLRDFLFRKTKIRQIQGLRPIEF